MGLSGTSFGLVAGFIAFALPQVLRDRGVPVVEIASITAIAISPGFWTFLVSPILDVWLSRRSYALALLIGSASLVAVSVMLLNHLMLLELILTAAYALNQLYYSALGGWLSTVVQRHEENQLSAWLTVANTAGFGTMATLGGELVRDLSAGQAAALIGGVIVLPALLIITIPSPAREPRLAMESFRAFWSDIFDLLRRRETWLVFALFITPCATFSLTNLLGGIGGDFGATQRQIGLLGGIGTILAGVCGSLILPALARRARLRALYLFVGVIGSLFTLHFLLLPSSVLSFALAILGENLFQGLAIACSVAIVFEAIGQSNPLAATNFAMLTAAYNVPIAYMLFVDGWGYGHWGVYGAFAVDGGLGVVACLFMATFLFILRPRAPTGT